MSQDPQRRYPGLNYFTTAQKAQFFGRDEEIEELLGLILSEKIVVLFGKSGYGKSSLLRAGILPQLHQTVTPVLVQLGAYQPGQSPTPVQTTIARLVHGGREDHPDSAFLEKISDPGTLWHRFKRQQRTERQSFLVIFDQFEEFDSYPAGQKNAFKQQLAELLFTRIPQAVRDRSDALPDEQQNLLAKSPEVKVVFAIREDRLSVLDGLADKLPAILHKRFRLRGLSDAQAREAVIKPAALPQFIESQPEIKEPKSATNPGETQDQVPLPFGGGLRGGVFDSPAFAYSPAALTALLSGLKKDETDAQARIEAFLLQICCENIEKTVIARHQAAPAAQIVIAPQDLPAFGRLFEEYYRGKIAALPAAAQTAARRMIEDELVKADPATGIAYRINVDGRQLTKMPGIDEVLLKRLTDDFLLRSEPNTTDGFSYEVSHDRLVEGILNAKTEYEAEQAQAQAERQAREEAERLRQEAVAREQQLAAAQIEAAREKSRRRRSNLLLAVALVALWIAGVEGCHAAQKKQEAETASAEAIRQKEAAITSSISAEHAKHEALAQKAAAISSDSLAQIEKRRAEAATRIALEQKTVAERNLAARQQAEREKLKVEQEKQEAEIRKLLAEALVFERAGEYPNAIGWLREVLRREPTNGEALHRLQELEKKK